MQNPYFRLGMTVLMVLVGSLVLLGLQLFGAIGSALQLAHGAADEKAAELKRLGVDPTFGLTLNLIYSAIAFSVFLWAWRQASR